jgi:hypothetical protein
VLGLASQVLLFVDRTLNFPTISSEMASEFVPPKAGSGGKAEGQVLEVQVAFALAGQALEY